MVAGVDEVGRGSWAGPLVVCAIVLPDDFVDTNIRDSKQLSLPAREQMSETILENAVSVGLGWASPRYIDAHGLTAATSEAMRCALRRLSIKTKEIHIDGNYNYLPERSGVKLFVKGDTCLQHIAAASIVAKVARDRFMQKMDKLHPGYGFITNVGYGSKEHKSALVERGVTPLHRLSWAPMAKLGNVA